LKKKLHYLTEVKDNIILDNTHVMWLKEVPLKFNIFIWCLFFNLIPTKDNLAIHCTIHLNNQGCLVGCGLMDDMNHLFVKCDFYDRLWLPCCSLVGS